MTQNLSGTENLVENKIASNDDFQEVYQLYQKLLEAQNSDSQGGESQVQDRYGKPMDYGKPVVKTSGIEVDTVPVYENSTDFQVNGNEFLENVQLPETVKSLYQTPLERTSSFKNSEFMIPAPSETLKTPKTPEPHRITQKSSHSSNLHIKAQTCPEYVNPSNTAQQAPTYPLSTTKYLATVLTFGPNNQIRGFRESVYLAIMLNRTLVLPPFFKHSRNDPTANNRETIVSPETRIDIQELNKLIPVISSTEFGKVCGHKFTALLQSGRSYCKGADRFNAFMEYSGMLNVNTRVHASGSHQCRTRAKWDLYPSAEQMSSHNSRQKRFSQTRNSQQLKYSQKSKFTEQNINLLADNKPFDLPFGRNELNELYPVEDPCAVWLFPYRNINLRISYMLDQDGLTAGRRRRLQNQSSYIQTTKDIINFTKRPKFVRDLVQELIPKVFENQEKFISMHWRYNEDDWFIHCDADGKKGKHRTIRDLPKRKQSRKTVLDYKSDICDFARNLTQNPDYIANALIKYLSYTSVNSIFIASPPSEEKFMEQVKSAVFTER